MQPTGLNKVPPSKVRSGSTNSDNSKGNAWTNARKRINDTASNNLSKGRAEALREKYKDLLMSDLEIEVIEGTNKLEDLLSDLEKN